MLKRFWNWIKSFFVKEESSTATKVKAMGEPVDDGGGPKEPPKGP